MNPLIPKSLLLSSDTEYVTTFRPRPSRPCDPESASFLKTQHYQVNEIHKGVWQAWGMKGKMECYRATDSGSPIPPNPCQSVTYMYVLKRTGNADEIDKMKKDGYVL